MSYLLALALVSSLIVIHELGHFLAAKWMGIPISRFSVGFGPKVWGFDWKRTEVAISLIPLGGYVLPAVEDEKDYLRISLKKRLFFSFGGPLANLLAAVLLFALINIVSGAPNPFNPVTPFAQTMETAGNILMSLSAVLSGPDQISSVIGIVSTGGQFVETGLIGAFKFAALITLNLAIFNLLPLPPLDGGKIILDIIGDSSPRLARVYAPACVMGWLLLMGVMAYATANDVSRLMAFTGSIAA